MTKYDEVSFDRSAIGRTVASTKLTDLSDGSDLVVVGEAGTGDLQAAVNLIDRLKGMFTEVHRTWRKTQATLKSVRTELRDHAADASDIAEELVEARKDRDNLKTALDNALRELQAMRDSMDKSRAQLVGELAVARAASLGTPTPAANHYAYELGKEKKRSGALEKELAETKAQLVKVTFPLTPDLDAGYLEALKTKPPRIRALEAALAADEAAEDSDWKQVRHFVSLAQMWTQLMGVDTSPVNIYGETIPT